MGFISAYSLSIGTAPLDCGVYLSLFVKYWYSPTGLSINFKGFISAYSLSIGTAPLDSGMRTVSHSQSGKYVG